MQKKMNLGIISFKLLKIKDKEKILKEAGPGVEGRETPYL